MSDLQPTGIISRVVLFLGPLHNIDIVIVFSEMETVRRTCDRNRLSEGDAELEVYTM